MIQNVSQVIFNSCDGFLSRYRLSCSSIGKVEFCVDYVSRQFSRLFAQMSKEVIVVVYPCPFLAPFLKKSLNVFLNSFPPSLYLPITYSKPSSIRCTASSFVCSGQQQRPDSHWSIREARVSQRGREKILLCSCNPGKGRSRAGRVYMIRIIP